MSERFVLIASVQRGVLEVPEILERAGQAAAFWQLREDESQALRVNFERVWWRAGWEIETPKMRRDARAERMMSLVEKVRMA